MLSIGRTRYNFAAREFCFYFPIVYTKDPCVMRVTKGLKESGDGLCEAWRGGNGKTDASPAGTWENFLWIPATHCFSAFEARFSMTLPTVLFNQKT